MTSLLFFKRQPFPCTLPGIRHLGKLVFCRAAPRRSPQQLKYKYSTLLPTKKEEKAVLYDFFLPLQFFLLTLWMVPSGSLMEVRSS